MKIIRDPQEMALHRSSGVGFVPTMGALHEGHLALMRQSKQECESTVVSIFVNPKQFGPREDYSKYPRTEERDLFLCEKAGADVVFYPDVDSIYTGQEVSVSVGRISEKWEGAHRPGHFDGVATVVAILFNIVRPKVAYFGKKDFQQCAVIDSLTKGLHFDIELRFVETVREADGLAMSSRNAYLSESERETAPLLYRTLFSSKSQIEKSIPLIPDFNQILSEARLQLEESGFEVDYLALVDEQLLEPVSNVGRPARLIVAAKLGKTRLIDNLEVSL